MLMIKPLPLMSRSNRRPSTSENHDHNTYKVSTEQTASMASVDKSQPPEPVRPTAFAQSSLPRSVTPGARREGLTNTTPSETDYSIALRIRNTTPIEGTPRNVLRRKAPSIECYSKNTRIPWSSSTPTPEPFSNPASKLGKQLENRDGRSARTQNPTDLPRSHAKASPSPDIQIQHRPTPKPLAESQIPTIPKELRGLSTSINARSIPNTIPHMPSASTPSTLYSNSPGPWSSRTSTPTSISSYSPSIWHPPKIGSRLRQPSPVIAGNPAQHRPSRPTPPLDKASSALGGSASTSPLRNAQDVSSRTQVSEKPQTESQKRIASLAKTPAANQPSSKLQPLFYPQSLSNDKSTKTQDEGKATKFPHDQTVQDRVKAQPSKPLTSVAPTRPSRPSRKGTSDLQLESSPVIQSNLPASRLPGHKRQGSSGTVNLSRSRSNSLRPPNESMESLASKPSVRITQATPPSNLSSLSGSKTLVAGSMPSNQTITSRNKEVKEPRTVKEQPKQPFDDKKRFGIFSKKSRSVPEVTGTKADKQNRKGPAAGTGHEGYGRYAQRGRLSSVGSNTSRAGSTSTSASASKSSLTSRGQPEMDDFLRDRLEPIIINGGGQDGGALARTQSEQSFSSIASTTISEPYRRPPHAGGYSTESIPTYGGYLAQSPEPFSYSMGDLLAQRKGEQRKPKHSVLKRRSFRKPHFFGSEKESRAVTVNRPSIDYVNAGVTSFSQMNSSSPTVVAPQDPKTEKEAKKKKSRWNFFQRSLHRKQSQADLRTAAMTEVPASVTKLPGPRQLAHYELLDNEQIDSDSLEDILRRVEDSPLTEEEGAQQPPVGLGVKKQHGLSVLLPEPPVALCDRAYDKSLPSPKVFFSKGNGPTFEDTLSGAVQVAAQNPRESRLASVGRIPKVIPRDDPPVQSFSRPFSTEEVPSVSTTADNPAYLSPPLPPVGLDFNIPVCSGLSIPDILRSPMIYPSNLTEFFAFSPRKGSDASSSSANSLAAVTAIIPPPGSKLTDDEVWGEYDDFIDHVVSSPDGQAPGLAYSRGPSNKVTDATMALQEGLDDKSDTLSPPNYPAILGPTSPELSSTKSSVHLRRSMVVSALHSSLAPSTAESFSEFYNSEQAQGDRNSKQETKGYSHLDRTQQPLPIPDERRLPSTNINHKRNTILLELAERNKYGAIAQANLRSGSLMTSRWLSFGRVLFSPAQNHVQSQQNQSRILVVDGLGNDDWSFYCALTYPTATVYNLSMSPSSTTSTNPAAWEPPSNHRTVHHTNIGRPFPFPKGFFTVVILRFPAACSEAELHARVSECKRVLRDGGYIELSILNLDMVNMGSRTRKAVRTLKERMFATDPTINLKAASDDVQRLLGKRGFENLNRCMVVVPVAGSIVASSDTSSSGQSTRLDLNTTPRPHGPNAPKPSTQRLQIRSPSEDPNVSLGDLLSDPSPSESNDESIAKMVARVGRWWYTRCYESAVLLDGNLDESMWSDRRLLRECQRRGTGFKLLIAYAQKPSDLPRRTASV